MAHRDGDGDHQRDRLQLPNHGLCEEGVWDSTRAQHAALDNLTSSRGHSMPDDEMHVSPLPPGLTKHVDHEPIVLAAVPSSQQVFTQPSQTVPAFGTGTVGNYTGQSGGGARSCSSPKRDQTNPSSKKRKAHEVPDWVHYDADIVDNLAKTRRFASECISEDLVSRMSMSEDGNEVGARASVAMSPSPLSKHEKLMGPCAGSFSTPLKPKINSGTRLALPAKLFEAELTVTTSPSDTKLDGGNELRKMALVRLALRNGQHAYETDTLHRNGSV